MAFSRHSFLGASVVNYTSNIGWGTGSPSEIRVTLVEDPRLGDSFLPFRRGTPNINHPVYFNHFGFEFSGLLQAWNESNSTSGMPTFTATLVDPREILAGAQLITSTYSGNVAGVPNLINIFGYMENQGFGLSEVNDGGMPWVILRNALSAITGSPAQGSYGGPLQFSGFSYGLDLSELPALDGTYRIAGPSLSLLDLISQICEDGGCDFFVSLVGLKIKVATVSRLKQPPLGTISAIANTNWGGTVVSSSSGLESRNEITSSFLIGGNVTDLHLTNELTSFWGYDINADPILGQNTFLWQPTFRAEDGFLHLNDIRNRGTFEADNPGPKLSPTRPARIRIFNGQNQHCGNWVYERLNQITYQKMTLNSSPVADLLGMVTYECSTLEMQMAKANYISWATYIQRTRPDIAARVQLLNVVQVPRQFGIQFGNPARAINDNPNNVRGMAQEAVQGDAHLRAQRLYQFVRGYADEYMGKKFAVSVPFVVEHRDSETLELTTSYEVADGGYLPSGSQPLGLSPENEDILQLPDTRFKAFVKYTNLANADLSCVSPQGTVIQGERNPVLFVECQVDPIIIFTPSPAVVITLPGPVVEKGAGPVGDPGLLAGLFNFVGIGQNFVRQINSRFLALRCSPPVLWPSSVAVPLKSNTQTYGPWQSVGAAGKVKVEQDANLTPWTFGGYEQMDFAGNARVASAVTNMQVGETGQIELTGTPTISLGGTLKKGGPNLTGIDVSIGKEGVTTRYRFATFTPKFGLLSKSHIDRMRRLNLGNLELRRTLIGEMRFLGLRNKAVQVANNSNRAFRAFMELAPAAVRRESPHDMFTAFAQYDVDVGGTRTTMQSSTCEEALTLTNADNDDRWQATASMHLNGLLRPFSTRPSANGQGVSMPSYNTPTITEGVPCRHTLDPWKAQNDVEFYAWGDEYKGLHAYGRADDIVPNPANARVMGLRGPVEVVGWGFDLVGNTCPANTEGAFANGLFTEWEPDYLRKQELWKAGPADLRWDEHRGVWTSQSVLKGRISGSLPAYGSGVLMVDVVGASGLFTLPVWNYFGVPVNDGVRAFASYVNHDNRWYVTSFNLAGVVSGEGGGGGGVS